MKLDDTVWGALLALLGAAVLVHVQGFPRIPGQNVGPALFPGLIGAALATCGLILVVRGLRARRRRGDGAGIGESRAESAWIEAPSWLRSPRHVLAFVVLVGVNVFYLLAVERLGFVVTAFVYLAALICVLRVRLLVALPVAFLMTLAIHYAFYKLLRVPLPWGALQGVAW